MNIDITKKYTTRSGLPVRIYATDGAGQHPIHGAIKYKNGWNDSTWCANGAYTEGYTDGSRSLIPVKTWRAWEEGEGPARLMIRSKASSGHACEVLIRAAEPAPNKRLFSDFIWLREDGTETPCGVEE